MVGAVYGLVARQTPLASRKQRRQMIFHEREKTLGYGATNRSDATTFASSARSAGVVSGE